MASSNEERARQAFIRAGFRGDSLNRIMAIAGRESGYNPRAANLNNTTDHSIGLTQINQLAHKGRFGTDAQLEDPDTNARAAWVLSKGGTDWSPWKMADGNPFTGTSYGKRSWSSSGASTSAPTAGTVTTGGGTDKQGAVLDALLNRKPGQSLARGIISNLRSGNYTTPTTTTAVNQNASADAPVSSSGAPGDLQAMIAEANRIDQAKLPYQWGGGHAGKLARGSKQVPLDCSGAVSRVLGIDPRVSGAFENWGEAGEGQQVTIYANGTHVLMKINGRFFGTSSTNPGGGAGWIPASAISPGYLSKFTARHPVGL